MQRARDHAFALSLVGGSRVDQQRARLLCGERVVGLEADESARVAQEVVDRRSRRSSVTLVPAILARPAQDDVVRRHDVAAPVGDPLDRGLERRILERLDLPAVVADEVVVVVAAR